MNSYSSLSQGMQRIQFGFLTGIKSVQPEHLLPKILRREGSNLIVGDKNYKLRDTYVVGFGKAVAGMIPTITEVLQTPTRNYLKKAIISVPFDFRNCYHVANGDNKSVEFYEGAKSNLPDEHSSNTTRKIVHLIKAIREDDLLIILISGGGSALLPFPISPLSLEDKTSIINRLSRAGASIVELNAVRKAISATKGGQLALMSKVTTITFILSDIIGSPLDMIASGPTVYNQDSFDRPIQVLKKYGISIENSLKSALENRSKTCTIDDFSHVNNVLIGDNNTALEAVKDDLEQSLKCSPLILSNCLASDAASIGRSLSRLAFSILESATDGISSLRIDSHIVPYLSEEGLDLLKASITAGDTTFCLLLGGETTVQVIGNGTGGRNQEMVLASSLELEELAKTKKPSGEIILLSGGTDGIDGPTDAAGAMTWYQYEAGEISLQVTEARVDGLAPEEFLLNNDSYGYFSKLKNGQYLLKPGHTGTNVMDIQILLIIVK